MNGLATRDAALIVFLFCLLFAQVAFLGIYLDGRINALEAACGVEQVEGEG